MTVVAAPLAVPTRADAEAAAAVVAERGVCEVLLVGSVARGTAGVGSDIDLVAIFADLDYSERDLRRRELEEVACGAVPWPVQVHVTDRAEWDARVGSVATSSERRMSRDAVTAAVGDVNGPVDWEKEMVLPMSDQEEALRYFNDTVLPCLLGVGNESVRGQFEDAPLSAQSVEAVRLHRLVSLCAAAALAVETSVKCMAILYGSPTPTDKELRRNGHTIGDVLGKHVPDPQRTEMQAAFDRLGVDLAELSTWRIKGTYPDNASIVHADADYYAPAYAAMAAEITGLVADHLRHALGSAAGDAVELRDTVAETISQQDVRSGMPRRSDPDLPL